MIEKLREFHEETHMSFVKFMTFYKIKLSALEHFLETVFPQYFLISIKVSTVEQQWQSTVRSKTSEVLRQDCNLFNYPYY